MTDINDYIKQLDKLARKLVNYVATKRIKLAICENKPVLIFQPTPRYMPAEVISLISNALREYGLVPVFKEKDDNLIVAYVKPEEIKACQQVKEQVSKLPEKLLKEEVDIDCIRLLMDILNKSSNRGESYYLLILKKEDCPACNEFDKDLYGRHLDLKGEALTLLSEAFERFIEVDSDKCSSFAKIFGVNGYPAFILFKDGKVAEKVEGWGDNVKEWLKQKVVEIAQANDFLNARLEQLKNK